MPPQFPRAAHGAALNGPALNGLAPNGSARNRPARTSPRSLRSAVLAVCLTGVLSIVIPFGLLMGRDGLVAAGLNRQTSLPAPRLTGCGTGQPLTDRTLHPGQCVTVTGGGFAPRELIQVRQAGRPGWHDLVWADDLGRFSLRFQLPAAGSAGDDLLTFTATNQVNPASVPAIVSCRFTVRAG